ncbi:MAG TPA: trypsin-like peptidase domain-containing protein [Vicinamibacterales bacterium]|nr:trypsin-like peptidase domain-containing protein [Vicinamibacterales bacterium]
MIRRLILIVVFVSCGFAAGMVLTGRMRTAEEAGAAAPPAAPAAQQAAPTGPPTVAGLPDLSSVASRAIPSVMNITSLNVVRQPNSPMMSDPLFRYFFGDDIYAPRNRVAQSLGSGVVVSSDGYIMTNNHVIGSSNAQVSVVLPDRRELRARIIGVDEATDIALLKVDARGLPVLPWGDSSKLRVAEWVLAIGNPFQLNQTVTLGIVSALGRNVGINVYEDFIQTDAAINPGNSGGALINARGELVGINTAIFSETGGYQGIGFAVPSNLARHVMDDLLKHGEVQRGTIPGISIANLTTQIAEQLGAPNTRGALVNQISPRAEAYQAGLRADDIITSFNGRTVEDASALMRMLADSKVGTAARLEILRESRRLEVTVPITRSRSTRGR